MWGANGPVSALALSGNTLYVGGSFTRIGPVTGSFAALDRGTGSPGSAFPKVDGEVFAVASDGAGGWFVGGRFTHVGNQTRHNLAHVLADGRVASWDTEPDDGVYCLQVRHGIVYAGGYFTSIGGQARSYIAALDAETGRATDWDPSANSPVLALFATDDAVYASGYFTGIGGQVRSYLASLDPATGQALPWDPSPDGPCSPFYNAIVRCTWEGISFPSADSRAPTLPRGRPSRMRGSRGHLLYSAEPGGRPAHLVCDGAQRLRLDDRTELDLHPVGSPEEPIGPNPTDQGSVCPGHVLSWTGPDIAEPVARAQPPAGNGTAPRGESMESEGMGEEGPDSARKAMEFFMRKREPEPAAGIPMEDYLAAFEHMKSMRQYSTALGQFLPLRSERSLLANAGLWRGLGPGNIGGRTRSLVIDPTNPDVLYAGAVAGGIWKTYDAGASWAPLDDLLANLAVTCLVLDPANSSVIYAGTGEGDTGDGVPGAGIFRSNDGGATWTQLPSTASWLYVNFVSAVNACGQESAIDTEQ